MMSPGWATAVVVVTIVLTILFVATVDVFLLPFYVRYRAWVDSLFDKKEDD